GFCWSVPPRTGRWDGPVSTATVVLGHDGVGIPLGQVVLVGEPVGPVRELEQTGSFVDSCEPLVESLPGHLRDAFDEVGVDLRCACYRHGPLRQCVGLLPLSATLHQDHFLDKSWS